MLYSSITISFARSFHASLDCVGVRRRTIDNCGIVSLQRLAAVYTRSTIVLGPSHLAVEANPAPIWGCSSQPCPC